MLEGGGGLRFSAKARQVRFGCPLAESNDFQRNRPVETFLPRTEHHALTAASDFFQQFVIAKVGQRLCRTLSLFSRGRSIRVTRFNIFSAATVIASGYRRAPEQAKAGLEQATGAASFRGVSWDFGPALWANSEYARHRKGAGVRSPLVLRKILSQVTLEPQQLGGAAHLQCRWTWQPSEQSHLAIKIGNADEIDRRPA